MQLRQCKSITEFLLFLVSPTPSSQNLFKYRGHYEFLGFELPLSVGRMTITHSIIHMDHISTA